MTRTTLVVLLAGSASGQDMFVNIFSTELPDTYVVGGDFFGSLPAAATSIGTIWADASFDITGNGPDVEFFAFNPTYETALGPPAISNGPTGSFTGNANSFFGTLDPTNPLFVAAFTYTGSPTELSLSLVGQNSVLFEGPSNPFGIIELYQDASGNQGTRSIEFGFPGFSTVQTLDIPWIPAPATLALAPVAFAGMRRRRT